jgi:hypothetical protein
MSHTCPLCLFDIHMGRLSLFDNRLVTFILLQQVKPVNERIGCTFVLPTDILIILKGVFDQPRINGFFP